MVSHVTSYGFKKKAEYKMTDLKEYMYLYFIFNLVRILNSSPSQVSGYFEIYGGNSEVSTGQTTNCLRSHLFFLSLNIYTGLATKPVVKGSRLN